MFDVKAEIKQNDSGLTVKHTLLINGKKTRNVNVSHYEGKHNAAALLRNLEAADLAADTAFAPMIRNMLAESQSGLIDAEAAVADVSNIKLYRTGRKFKLIMTSKFLNFDRMIYINDPYDLVSVIGSVLTLIEEGRDVIETLVYKMALHQRLNELFAERALSFRRVISGAFGE
jgi:hypothetical protein